MGLHLHNTWLARRLFHFFALRFRAPVQDGQNPPLQTLASVPEIV
jgi:hypothetical protein